MKSKSNATSAVEFRKNVCAVLDQVIETASPVEIRRKGQVLRIVLDKPYSKLSRLKKRDCIIGDPEELVHLDWTRLCTEPR